eukprot:s295_g39.t1
MAGLLDSEAQFVQRTLDLKLSDDVKRGLKRNGLQTFGTYAYAHGQPGQNIVDGLQDSVSTPDTTSIKKVPTAEREAKMSVLRRKLTGLLLEGPLEPGHSLLDATANMFQLNEVRYLPPEKCVSRTFEVMNMKSTAKQLDVSADHLIIKEKTEVPEQTVTSALQVQEAFQRRGIALVFADLIRHETYTRYLTTLFGHLHREPPAGYARCTVSQLVAADKLVWQALLEEGVRPKRDEAGVLALDEKLLDTLQSYRVSFSLLPLVSRATASTSGPKKPKASNSDTGGKGNVHAVQKPWIKNKGGKKGSKGKPRVPHHIFKLGGTAANPEGEPICFAYNSEGGCKGAAEGAKCGRGLHVCAKCYNVHPIHQHGSGA